MTFNMIESFEPPKREQNYTCGYRTVTHPLKNSNKFWVPQLWTCSLYGVPQLWTNSQRLLECFSSIRSWTSSFFAFFRESAVTRSEAQRDLARRMGEAPSLVWSSQEWKSWPQKSHIFWPGMLMGWNDIIFGYIWQDDFQHFSEFQTRLEILIGICTVVFWKSNLWYSNDWSKIRHLCSAVVCPKKLSFCSPML